MWLLIAAFLLASFFLVWLYGAAKRQLWVLLPASGDENNPFKAPAK